MKSIKFIASLILLIVLSLVSGSDLSAKNSPKPCIFRLERWIGRLGNNFFQIKNAIRHGICYKALVQIPKNQAFPFLTQTIDFTRSENEQNLETLTCSGEIVANFFGNVLNLTGCNDTGLLAAINQYVFGSGSSYFFHDKVAEQVSLNPHSLVVHIR